MLDSRTTPSQAIVDYVILSASANGNLAIVKVLVQDARYDASRIDNFPFDQLQEMDTMQSLNSY
jgi:hypothetical protein